VIDTSSAVQWSCVKVLRSSVWSTSRLYKSFLSARVSHCQWCCRRGFCELSVLRCFCSLSVVTVLYEINRVLCGLIYYSVLTLALWNLAFKRFHFNHWTPTCVFSVFVVLCIFNIFVTFFTCLLVSWAWWDWLVLVDLALSFSAATLLVGSLDLYIYHWYIYSVSQKHRTAKINMT